MHDPGKVLLDVALAVAPGGDYLADVGTLRAESGRVRVSGLRPDGLPPHRHPGQATVDLDGVLVPAHSDKQDATATWKKTYGHHPLTGFVDHRRGGIGEPMASIHGGRVCLRSPVTSPGLDRALHRPPP